MSKRTVIGVVLLLLALPAAVALSEAVIFHVRNRPNGTIVSSGKTREYFLYVPRNYDRTKPTPLVISMHGAGGWPVQQRDLSLWNDLADREGFLVVYPSGMTGRGPRTWRVGRNFQTDVRFISDLIDKLQADFNIDPSRIYANGISNGGGMSFVLSCRLSERIAAVGMVGAAQTLPWSWCTNDKPMPVIAFHGTADPMMPYDGGTSWVADGTFPSVSAFMAKWARRNRCEPAAVESSVTPDVERREYQHCADGADVVLYTIRGGGHTWPGGQVLPEWFTGPTNLSVSATNEMWAFFREHRVR